MTLRFAIIGFGKIASPHAEAIDATPGTSLVAVADPAIETRRAAVERWKCPAYESLETLLAATEVDAAIVSTPPALHRAQAERLLEAGAHVLCEKPLALTSSDARAMAARAEAVGRVLAVSSKFRYVTDLEEGRRRIEAGAIGRPVSCEVTFCSPLAVFDRWILRPELSGGGVLMDNGPHAYDVLSAVIGRPQVVSAAFGPRTASRAVEDTAEILFRTDAGLVGRIALSWICFTKDLDYLVVQGTGGTLRLGWGGGALRSHGDREWTSFGSGYDKAAAFRNQLEGFVSAVRAGRGESARDGICALEFIERAYECERRSSEPIGAGAPSVGGITP